jgi:predicted nucleic acid-binding protein
VALHVRQHATEATRALYESDPRVVVWALSDVEIRSALCRLGRDGAMPAADVTEAVSRVASFWNHVHVVGLVDAVRARAKRMLDHHPLRAADALQLGAALTAADDEPPGWEFVCLDERLAEAARRERFTVVP